MYTCIYLYMNVWFPPGQPEVVYLLLNAGLNPRQKDSYGQVQIVDTTCMYMYIHVHAHVHVFLHVLTYTSPSLPCKSNPGEFYRPHTINTHLNNLRARSRRLQTKRCMCVHVYTV